MNKGLAKTLQVAMVDEKLVKIDRSPTTLKTFEGYVVGYSDALVLVHYVADNVDFDGYCVVRTQDIGGLYFVDDERSVTDRALRLRDERPVPLGNVVSLEDWRSLLHTAYDLYPLMVISREKIDDAVCFIGALVKLTEQTVTLREIEPGARWGRRRRFRYRDITAVEFGGGYERALWLVAERDVCHQRPRRRSSR